VFEAAVTQRTPKGSSYAILLVATVAVMLVLHGRYLRLPFFWDELGQFVPAALDILHDGALVPHSTVPNVHPPGVMLYLAAVWRIFGYSIAITRVAMVLVASAGVYASFLLAIRLSRGIPGAPAFMAVALLVLTPLFYTQAMMAQLDMPAITLSIVALLFFIEDRFVWSAAACTVLVLCKETGAILPVLFAGWMGLQEKRWREALYFVIPFVPLAAWLALLWAKTGHPLGDPGFAHYNVGYSLHPVRIVAAVVRRLYFIFIADFRWLGLIALWVGGRKAGGIFSSKAWKICGLFAAAHIAAMCVFGGAALERYLLPALPVVYAAMAAAWSYMRRPWRAITQVACAAGLVLGWFWNSPYPMPFENNLAMVDFIELQQAAAEFLEDHAAGWTVASAWPYTAALRSPEYGFVSNKFPVI